MTDRVRIGADHNGQFIPSEVTRIDFDTKHGTYCLVVEYLASQNVTVIDLFPEDEPVIFRHRLGTFPGPSE